MDAEKTDIQLIKEFKRGNNQSFEILINRYADRAYGLASRMLKNQEDAEEVLQDVFTTVFKKISSFEGKSSFASWFYRITVNSALMKIRKRKQNRSIAIEDAIPSFHDSSALRTSDTQEADVLTQRKQIQQALEEAISKLPEEYRGVYVLRDIDGLSSRQVGKMLKLSIPAVKSRLHRGRLMLRRKLAKLYREILGGSELGSSRSVGNL